MGYKIKEDVIHSAGTEIPIHVMMLKVSDVYSEKKFFENDAEGIGCLYKLLLLAIVQSTHNP